VGPGICPASIVCNPPSPLDHPLPFQPSDEKSCGPHPASLSTHSPLFDSLSLRTQIHTSQKVRTQPNAPSLFLFPSPHWSLQLRCSRTTCFFSRFGLLALRFHSPLRLRRRFGSTDTPCFFSKLYDSPVSLHFPILLHSRFSGMFSIRVLLVLFFV